MNRQTLEKIQDALGKPSVIFAMLLAQIAISAYTSFYFSMWFAVVSAPFIALDTYRFIVVLHRSSWLTRSSPRDPR